MSELEPASSRIGTTLRGKWTLERLLGEGGMASVYVARHKIGRLDAIKILHPTIAASPQLRARFEQEAHVVNRFRHGGAVEIRDIDTSDDGAPFLVMELLEGETLSSLVRRTGRALDVPTVLRMADQVLDVLAAAHAHGIIHRDIKPDNLMLLADGRVKVLDFGIARLRERVNEDLKTRTGTTLGTVAYMPPEQAKGLEIDARADVYAVGATMFRLLANRRVHEADTEVERLMKVVTEAAPPLATVAPQVPAPVGAVVDRALAFDRDRRYADAAAMQAEVRAAMAGDSSPYVPPAVQAPVTGPPIAIAPQAAPPGVEAPTVGPAARRDVGPGGAPTRALSPQPPASARFDGVPTRAAPDEATRAASGLVHEAATVAAPPPRSPAMLPTAATVAVAAPVPAIAPVPPTRDANKTALVAALIAGGALLVLGSIAGAVALFWALRTHSPGDSPDDPLTAPSASAAQLAPAEAHTTTEAPPTARKVAPRPESPSPPWHPPPQSSPAAPPPQPSPATPPPPPSPAPPPPGHGHGRGHGHER